MSSRPIGRVEIRPDPTDFLADDGRAADIRIYLSPRAVGIAVFIVVVIGRLAETLLEVIVNRL